MNAIETTQLKKSYGAVPIVKGIDLIVEKGEIFGFLGRNGAGKSTFINMLTGIIQPNSGTYSLLGVKGSNDQVKKRIGVMPDYSTLYGSLTAVEHLKFLSALSGNPAGKDRCMEVLQLVGLESHAHKKAAKFSFGMKKKLGIAQAIIHEPELIFLDEPTSGLDAESAIHIQKLIKDLQKKGATIFMTSHNLYEVEKICTRIAIMKEGQIVNIGTMEELRKIYRSTITVKLKHSSVPKSEQVKLHQWLESVGTDLEMKDPYMTINIDDEKKIADMIRAFNQCKVDILRVKVKEPSLEEIFLAE
ncbi:MULTISPECIES: ATP-binding cassette domain-containing protein [Peribacillus]|uniref:ABC transporter ATP-binding protein n=1 Tax=Peribacillus TaxID=2675229 RepID=UPI000552994E|nr:MULTISPECIES: ABC transporter ATP-binding protein [Peribacillus]KRF54739.1 ABC transporter ATP-binding protein [Bacillus sp. Soil745]MCR8871640.1 ABC transporter ATP-binding protein [Peribacillus frigoritolerans]MED3832498.1 ABC transporter ATP-binding protein [Peribacillus frigoritolerans]MED3846162.1 ABC transporter ATP-binding protein [Peribacillus frigoritolerans]PAK39212.1 ABC transporter ATP-binding protein [Peribacillus simplex]